VPLSLSRARDRAPTHPHFPFISVALLCKGIKPEYI
jgi:hypothetical protein